MSAPGSVPQRFVVRIGDRSHQVEVHADGRVLVDDLPASWSPSGDGRLVIRDEAGRQDTVVLAPGVRPQEASIAGQRVPLQIQSAAQAALDEAMGGAGNAGSNGTLKAPMPGRIVKIAIAVGDRVEQGDPTIIIEAMKMENELGAPAAGVVESIEVEPGQAVESGAVLMKITVPTDED